MRFYVSEKVFEMIPDAQFGLVSVEGGDNRGEEKEIADLLNKSIEECSEHFKDKKVKNEPELQPYREAFRAMGINPNRYMCAAEALMTRVAKGQGMHSINKIVDMGNALSYKYIIPIGAHDLDSMMGDFGVRPAVEGDTFLPFGAEEREPVPEGEVVYVTGNHVRTRRWTWRQGDEGKITEETGHVLFIIDGFESNLDSVMKCRQELADLCRKYLGGKVKEGLINKENMEFETQL